MKLTLEAEDRQPDVLEKEVRDLTQEVEDLKKEREKQGKFIKIKKEQEELDAIQARMGELNAKAYAMEEKAKVDADAIILQATKVADSIEAAAKVKADKKQAEAEAVFQKASAQKLEMDQERLALNDIASDTNKQKEDFDRVVLAYEERKKNMATKARSAIKALQELVG